VVATTPPTGITLGPDNKLWMAGFESDSVHRFSTDKLEELEVTFPAGSRPFRIASGTDGNLWVTSFGADAIDRVTPTGVRTRFPLPAGAAPKDIAAGPDGALWFTESGTGSIGRIATDGAITHYPIPTSSSSPWGIAAGPDGALWFTENASGKIGRLVPDPPAGPPPPASDTTAPVFTGRLRAVPARFRVARRAHGSRRARAGTTFRWALSEPGTVTIRLQRRRGRRWVRAGQLRRDAAAGRNRLRFSGRIKGKALRRGRYRGVARAVDPAGNRSNASRTRFTIVRG
jgi:sugar lactone lactonase YvrE